MEVLRGNFNYLTRREHRILYDERFVVNGTDKGSAVVM